MSCYACVFGQFLIKAQPQLKNELNVIKCLSIYSVYWYRYTSYIFNIVFSMVRIYVDAKSVNLWKVIFEQWYSLSNGPLYMYTDRV